MIASGTQVLDRGEIRRRLDVFVHDWTANIDAWNAGERSRSEKSNAQRFWEGLLAAFGVNTARKNLYEHNAKRASTGGHGFIDFFWSGLVIGEAKSVDKPLDDAVLDQALDYLNGGSIAAHEMPRFVLLTNFQSFRVVCLDTETPTDITFTLAELPENVDALMFLAGFEPVSRAGEEDASIHAAELMANLYTALVGDDADESVGDEAPVEMDDEDAATQAASMFLTRLLFLLYGDDAGLWETDLFLRFVEYDTTPDTLSSQLSALFQVLNTPEHKRRNVPDGIAAFPYVNGALFADPLPITFFTAEMREALLAACRFRWTRISVSVFGAMFQLVKSKEARRAAGEHYTSEANILKTIGPLFLDEYEARADRLIANKSTTAKQLAEFQDELASNIYVDPACGAGNFLNLAYARLRDIETRIIVERRRRLGETNMSLDATLEQKLTIDRFYGFEIGWWPAKIAETAMFLVDHQANRKLAAAIGAAPERLPIRITAHIVHGNALQLDWADELPEVAGKTWIFGNPPFIGARTMSKQQKADLNHAWQEQKGVNDLDFVTGWHAKTMQLLAHRAGEFAFVTTNSITQGQPVPALFGPLFDEGWRIKFAHRTFAWDSQTPGKAAVHCVIVGFTRDKTAKQRLWDYEHAKGEPVEYKVTEGVNAYLVDGPNILVHKTRDAIAPQMSPVRFGSMPGDGGNLIVEADKLDEVLEDPIATKYLRPFQQARELVRGLDRWCLWMADSSFDPADITASQTLRERVQAVRTLRLRSKREATQKRADFPYLFQEVHQPNCDYVAIPRHVSESRRYFLASRFSPQIITGDANFTAVDPEGLLFGLVSSSMFMAWQRTVGGRIKSDLRFSATLTWNTFPVPELDAKTRAAIIAAGQGVLAARELYPERSLADAYNPLAMDPALVRAHDKLDVVVDKAMGAPRKLASEKQRLEVLFARYAELTADQ